VQILDTPLGFAHDATAGFAAAYARYVQVLPGTWGVVRRTPARPGKVGLVVGGGSGHYPAFCGLVGTGMADGAVIGEVFTSPSAEQVYRVARAADSGAGTLVSFGNYAGDVLNFGAARDRLIREGADCRIVLVTDDIASAPVARRGERRGIAGNFTVYKMAGAAAERGDSLDEVERIARLANAQTRSFGVAFTGCTLPGAASPLFEVAEGTMELGLGIHGEPGVRTVEAVNAAGLARLLVEPLLAERPPRADGRVALLVNGLGASKYEEMFVLFGHLQRTLADSGVKLVAPEVGEYVTSLDMRGVSLTMTWLDDELEELWREPADTPAFRRARVEDSVPVLAAPTGLSEASSAGGTEPHVDTASAPIVRGVLAAMLGVVRSHEQLLGRLDAAAGDGDHGTAMVRGFTAAKEAAGKSHGDAGDVLAAAAEAFADQGAGTSGMLWGVMLKAAGGCLTGPSPDARDVCRAVAAARDALQQVGGAVVGDRTMVDTLAPFSEWLATGVADGRPLAEAWTAAAGRAIEAAEATAGLLARRGRARPLADRGLGTPDPGATSLALCLQAVVPLFDEMGVQE
jgi:dihydroxyacetone kinase